MELSIGKAILDVIWLCILLVMFHHFWKKRQMLSDAQGWLKAKGHITQYELIQVGHNLWPKVEYEYCVYEQNLIGHYLFLDTTHNTPNSKYSRHVAYQAALAYKDHLEVDIYYNPNRPEESALDVTIPTKLTGILVVISILIVIQIMTLIARLL